MNRLLYRVKNGTVTKYVYGSGLIGEETQSAFKTYHFDSRGSTVAITDASGTVTDTFAYDAYGNLLSRTGTSEVIFGYCGKFGVITDENGLAYMRARYYVPEMRRFVNADLLAGGIADIASLNRYAYANGNPISNIDPYGLSPWDLVKGAYRWAKEKVEDAAEWVSDKASEIGRAVTGAVKSTAAVATVVAVKATEAVATAVITSAVITGEKIVDTKNAVVDTVSQAVNHVEDAISKVGTSVSHLFESGKEYIAQSIDKGIDKITNDVPLLRTLREIHYGRNRFNFVDNTASESYYRDVLGIAPENESSSIYHQNHKVDGELNRKYVCPGIKFMGWEFLSPEIVFYSDGTVNNTPEDMGTVNFVSPKGEGINWLKNNIWHFILDVVPYYLWGNSENDSTTISQRIMPGG